MSPHPTVLFLRDKIMELQQALFFDLSSSVLKLPTSVINILHIDEIGQLWFFISKPSQNTNEFEREFLSRLELYRKGKAFYIHLSGKSFIVSDPEEINHLSGLSMADKQMMNGRFLLLKMKVDDIAYYPLKQPTVVNHQENTRKLTSPSALIKSLQYIVKDIIPVFQSH